MNFLLCCYFIVNQTFNTQNFELKCLEKFDEEGEIGTVMYENLKSKYPKYFEKRKDNWDTIFQELNIDKNVKIILKNKVSSKNSLEEINDKKKNK